MKLADAINLFLGEHIETTRRSYEYVLADMRDFVGPARSITDVQPYLLIEYAQNVRQRESVQSDATYNKYIKTTRVFFNWCVRAKLVEESPAQSLKLVRRPKLIERKKAMPDRLYNKVLEYARWNARYHALVLFLGDTGCRIGGAAGLQWPDVDLDEKTARVTEKGQPPRPVFYGDACRRALIRWQLEHSGKEGQHVFQKEGRRIRNKSLGKLFERICVRAGIGPWGPHSLRHRKGHALADQRTAPTIAAKLLGHSSPVITLRSYYPQDWERVQEEAAKLHQPEEKPVIKLREKVGDT